MNAPVKFLVVDPLAGVQTFCRQLLQGYGFAADSILCCADPDAALAQGLLFKPDMLITDWFGKSDLTGLALFQRLKGVSPELQLGLMSFEVTPEHEAQAQAAQALYLLRKPFTADQLRSTLRESFSGLARQAPQLHSRMNWTMRQTHPSADLKRVALPSLPAVTLLPALKPGDKVRYKGETQVVQYVVHRHGETAVQFKGKPDLVPESRLERLN